MIRNLDGWFPGIATRRNAEFRGSSNKVYRFDLEAVLEDGTVMLLDEVKPKRVNNILAANFDVGRREDERFSTWAVFDPAIANDIGAPSLSLLGSVVKTVSIDDINAAMIVSQIRA